MTTNRLVLHEHPFAAYCWKPLIALYELGLPFERNIVTDEAARQEPAEDLSVSLDSITICSIFVMIVRDFRHDN
jgi:hypothetical protein